MKSIQKKAIINTVEAASANYVDDTSAHNYIIRDGATGYANILPPIPHGSIKAVEWAYSQTEVTKIATLGTTDETIVSGRKYQFGIFNMFDNYEGERGREHLYGYTAPAALTGTAATDRYNMYYALQNKINNYAGNYVTAYILYKFAFDQGTTATGVVGTTTATPVVDTATTNKVRAGAAGVQETSAVTCNVAKVTISSGALSTNDAAGYIWVYNISDTASWSALAKTLTFTDTSSGATESFVVRVTSAYNATASMGQGLAIVDDASYSAQEELDRRYANEVYTTKGFVTATVDVVRVPYYDRGIGTRMLELVPVFNREGNDVVSGDGEFILNAAPVAGTTYMTVKIILNRDADADPLAGMTVKNNVIYTLYLAEDAGHANVDALKGTLVAMT